jgi:hypothetical protein
MSKKKAPILKNKPHTLEARWGREDRHSDAGITYAWGEGCSSADASLLNNVIGGERYSPIPGDPARPSLLDELKKRGYDLTTLKISIQKCRASSQ